MTIQRAKCGKTSLTLPVLGAGCWAYGGGEYWGAQDDKDVEAVVRRSVELGVNFFDTAEAYNDGRSEEALGRALKGIPRDKVLIGTKISPSNAYPKTLTEHCEASLKRLGMDYVDLYMVHWPIHPHSIRHFTKDEKIIQNPPKATEAFATLQALKKQGKIRAIGVSNFGVARLEEALKICPDIIINELPYSLLTRAIELEVVPFCKKNGLGVLGYMTLLQGLLADIFPTLKDVPVWQRRTRHFHFKSCELTRHGEEGAEAETDQAISGIRALAKENGMPMPEIAVKWALANPDVTCRLVGARSQKELEANVKAAEKPLAPALVQRLNAITDPVLKKLGGSFDYYESTANDRTK
ncbi:MAG: aldo/keto reductase [Planctomycetota bacterium]